MAGQCRFGSGARRRADPGLVRNLDCLAEMRCRLLKRGAAQRLVAGLAPPFDRSFGEARLREMMRDDFRLVSAIVGNRSRNVSAMRRCSTWRRLFSRLS